MPFPAEVYPLDRYTLEDRLDLLGRLWDSLLDAGPPPFPDWHARVVTDRLARADADPGGRVTVDQLRADLLGGAS